MSPDLLYVVTVVSNPLRTASRPALAKAFVARMLAVGVHLTLVECVLGQRPFEFAHFASHGVNFVGVRHTTICWHKESLINIGISRLPASARYIAWIDADIAFRNHTWAADTVHALQQYSVIQPWQHAYDLGPQDQHLETHTSFTSLYVHGKSISPQWRKGYTFGHPGYAWAARREIIEAWGGLYETAVLGSADHNMALGFLGRITETFPADISPQFTESMLAWQARGQHAVGRRIGYVPGTIEHTWHGPKIKRAYVERWNIMRTYKFNPVTDVRHNLEGVTELTGDKPDFQHAIEAYFASRDEDSNTMG